VTQLFKQKPFVIAEIGSNYRNIEDALLSVAKAKGVGADAVKFQFFSTQDLYGPRSDWDKPVPLPKVPLTWLPRLKEKADACGIELMCSAFSPKGVHAVNPYVSAHKIASSELTYPQLLEAVKACGKPILMSVGASSKHDIKLAMDALRGGPQVCLLYCVSAYPARMSNLFFLDDLKQFGAPIGLSDHSLEVIYPALSAVRHFGAVVIEKHVNFVGATDTPDAPHSLDETQFKTMCDYLRGIRDPLDFQPMPEERDMFLRHNRRLLAHRPIAAGETLHFGVNYGCYRSPTDDMSGMHGMAWELVEGQPAKQDIAPGQGVNGNNVTVKQPKIVRVR
jgi:pseudaminic acid synthase